ncbi:MAG: hypothetical protein IK120_04085 [Muribaculaceae bacterium]|nr:hypothetical protein [Muribaculaceae bacterium]
MKKNMSEEKIKRLVTVMIPIYTLRLGEIDLLSLRRCFEVLGGHDIAIVKPHSLDISQFDSLIGGNITYRVEEFDDKYFAGREGYNRLMLSAELYERFIDSQYLFVHQADVYVFRDELEQWCNSGYDYIGAPWLPALADIQGKNLFRRAFYLMRRFVGSVVPGFHAINLKYKVGNGGCSLRNTRSFLEAARDLAPNFAIASFQSAKHENFEDVFWSVRVNDICPGALRIAPCDEAARFSIESHPETAMTLTGGELPMATHAFARRRNRSFWQQHIPFPPI